MTTLRIGRPPRISRRELARRLIRIGLRYLGAYLVVTWACYWLGDIHLAIPGFAIAAMVCNPFRPKTSPRPAFASGVGKAVPAVEHVSADRRRLRLVWRRSRITPGLIPLPPVGG